MLKNEHVFFNTTCFIAGAPRCPFHIFSIQTLIYHVSKPWLIVRLLRV